MFLRLALNGLAWLMRAGHVTLLLFMNRDARPPAM
jgi:hypothetical protein